MLFLVKNFWRSVPIYYIYEVKRPIYYIFYLKYLYKHSGTKPKSYLWSTIARVDACLAAGIVWSKMLSYILAKNTTVLLRNVLIWAAGTSQLALTT